MSTTSPPAGVDAAQQLNNDVSAVGAGNFNTLWFDVETGAYCGDAADNCNFLGAMISAGHVLGIHMGVYSSAYMWGSLMGVCTVGADNGLPLWYAHYDGSRSYSHFSPFGGWNTPSMKQYMDSTSIGSDCGINADANWIG